MTEAEIFKKGSTTYYFSSKFFPANVREDVFRFYSFVRVADDFVDHIPAKKKEFNELRSLWNEAKNDPDFSIRRRDDDSLKRRVIKNIVHICRKYDCDPNWVESFFDSMQSDLTSKPYKTVEDSLKYVYGSAEVIGLFMSRILDLPPTAEQYARLQGRAMQWINFIRDIDEDNQLGRSYFPEHDLKAFGLNNLTAESALVKPDSFAAFVEFQISRYEDWQKEASKGFKYIPKRLRVPLQTAVDMYNWTAGEIIKDPLIVFKKKVKPSRSRVLASVSKNTL